MAAELARGGWLLAAVVLVAATSGCSTVAAEADATRAPPPSDAVSTGDVATPATTTTTVSSYVVTLTLDGTERLALRGGVSLAVIIDGREVGRLGDGSPQSSIEITGPTDVEFVYLDSDGMSADVRWTRSIRPDDSHVIVVQPWRNDAAESVDFVLAWQRNRSNIDDAVAEVAATPVTVVSPLWWNINPEAELGGTPDSAYVAAMHELGIDVWPAVQGLHAEGLHVLLNDPSLRAEVVSRLSEGARNAGADGVNVDLEGFWDEDAEAFSTFVEELADAVHAWGGVVSYDLVPRSDRWDVTPPELAFWSTAPQRRRLAAAVDYTVLMAYDQHNRYRPAGPVAAPDWVEEMIVYQLRYSDPQSIILGIPAYGRVWDPEELDAPQALGLGALAVLDGERSPDPEFGIDRVELPDGRFYWTDNEMTAARVALGRKYGLSGVAVWRLGLADALLWEAVR